mgnify:FL=1
MCCDDARAKLNEIHRMLTGGEDPSQGMFFRVVQLEQSEKRKEWWGKTALGAAIVALIGAAWTTLTSSGKHP